MQNQIIQKIRKYGPKELSVRAIRRLLIQRYWYDSTFDKRYDINTSMLVSVDELEFDDPQAQGHAQMHSPCSPYKVRAALKVLKRHMGGFETSCFVDYGCGAGRAMMVAAEAGFKKIVGIELSSKLVTICKKNIANYSNMNKAANLTVLAEDAATYLPSKECNVFFFYVPFSEEIYKQAMANLALSRKKDPREIYVLDFDWSDVNFSDYGYRYITQIEGVRLYKSPA